MLFQYIIDIKSINNYQTVYERRPPAVVQIFLSTLDTYMHM